MKSLAQAKRIPYFIYYATSQYKGRAAIKIGISAAPWRRVKTIGDAIGHEVVLLASYSVANKTQAAQVERRIHNTYREYSLGHEWFEPASEILEEIDRLGPDDSREITADRIHRI